MCEGALGPAGLATTTSQELDAPPAPATASFAERNYQDIRNDLLARREIALLDVREEDPHAQAHPLFAANLSLSRIELDAYTRIPRRDTPITVFDNGESLAQRAAAKLVEIGYTNVALLKGGLDGWAAAGGELFRDVNVPSKAFGELVEAQRHTPSLSAQEVQALIAVRADVVIVDARRYDEYQTMSIPGATSVPGGELVYRVRELAPDPHTQVIVNCAGRTRSIIGAQSLLNALLPNPVAALRNGTIGWTLAGQELDHGAARRHPEVSPANHDEAADSARRVADLAGVQRLDRDGLARLLADRRRTVYRFDVRTPEEYAAGHVADFRSAPGGQLVQETDMFAPVRGAAIVLVDRDGVRANMTASWLAQMGWEAHVFDGAAGGDFTETGDPATPTVPPPSVKFLPPRYVAELLAQQQAVVVDFVPSAKFRTRHIAGSWFALRSDLHRALRKLPKADQYVLTCSTSTLARYIAPEFEALTSSPVAVLEGGVLGWLDAGLPVTSENPQFASQPIDRYRRPYEGTGNASEAMQAYLDWEYGLVAQLARDGTHGFRVI
jgi:rhodanese-related sulfurtransferase